MRTVTITYETVDDMFTMHVEDNDGQFVDVQFEGDKAYLISQLHGDEKPVFGSSHADDAESSALALMGIPTTA